LTSYDHPSIAANSVGAPFTVLLQLPATPPPGFALQDMYIVMRTDALNQVPETNENNNFGQVGDGRDRERINVTVTPPRNLGFKIDVVFPVSALTATQRAVFQFAADRWSSVISGDLPDAGLIDDVQIIALGVPIDGPLGVLGSAGPTAVRTDYGNLPIQGQMRFDSADLALLESSGDLFSTILHEMGHVLGIGTLWQSQGLVTDLGTFDPRFRGTFATAEYNRIFGRNESSVPIESFATAGPGSAEGHWRESTFTNELMTPFLGSLGEVSPLSRVTVASLADLGYQVNLANADVFVPTPQPGSLTASSSVAPSRSASIGSMTYYRAIRPADALLVPLVNEDIESASVETEIVPIRSGQSSTSVNADTVEETSSLATDLYFAEQHAYIKMDSAADPWTHALQSDLSHVVDELVSAALAE
jgi:hypothetical protein